MSKNVKIRDSYTGRSSILTENDYNNQMKHWASEVQQLAKMNASLFLKGKKKNHTYRSGKKAGKSEKKLRSHIQYDIVSQDGETAGIGYKFPVHGIFREYGVGNGSPRTLAPMTKRSMSDWLSGVLHRKEDSLVNIVAEYYGDKVVRTLGFKK